MTHEILQHLVPDEISWGVLLPAASGELFGHRVFLSIMTDSSGHGAHPVAPSTAELSLATLILNDLAAIIRRAALGILEHENNGTSRTQHASRPRIWIDRATIADEGPLRWALVVHHDQWPDFAWHVEFEGTRYLETWAGT